MSSITIFIGGLRGGGAEQVCVTLANCLAAKGWRVELIVLNLKGAVRNSELDGRIELVNLNVDHSKYTLFALVKYLKKNKPRTILSFNRQISVVLALARLLSGSKFRLISRNIIFLSMAENEKKGLWHGFISKYLIKKFYPMSDRIIAQSDAMKDDLIKYLRIKKEKVIVINNPINIQIDKFTENNNLKKIKKENYLLCVGRLEKQKAFHYAIEAFAGISNKFYGLRLKIVGKGSLEQDLKKQVGELGVANKVDFEGYQKNMIPYYLGARATLLTSVYEGFPNVLVESVALGTPVVAFDCPSGPREIIKNGVNGYLVRYQDKEDLEGVLYRTLHRDWCPDDVSVTASRFSSKSIIDRYIHALSTKR